MSFLFFVIGLGLFFYLLSRISTVERKLDLALKGKLLSPGQSASQGIPQQSQVQPASSIQSQAPMQQATQPLQGPQPHQVRPVAKRDSHTEFAFGSKVLTGVGIFAVLAAVGFFLRFAFEKNLISPGARVGLGIILGLIIAGIGHALRKKFPGYGLSLVGGGLGVIYISIYAAYDFYGLISATIAFILMLLTTAIGVGIAIWYNSQPLVAYAFLGAYIMPFLLPVQAADLHPFFIYLLIINLGVLLVARFKVWPFLTLGSLLGTSILYVSWIFGSYQRSLFMETIVYCTILFLIYFLTSMLNFVFRDRDYKHVDGFLIYAVPTIYFLLNILIVTTKDSIALMAFVIGLFYIVMAAVLRAGFSQLGDLKKFSTTLLATASPYIAVAIALHFEGSIVTVLWAVEAIVMTLIGFILNSKGNRVLGIALALLVGIKALITDLDLASHSEAIFNTRTAILALVTILYVVLWLAYRFYAPTRTASPVDTDEQHAGRYTGAIGAFFIPWLWIVLESHMFIDRAELYLPVFWAIYFFIVISLSFLAQEKIFRYMAYGASVIALLITMGSQWSLPASVYVPLFNIRVLTALVYVVLCAYTLWLMRTHVAAVGKGEQHMKPVLHVVLNAFLFCVFSLEIVDYFNNQLRTTGVQAQYDSIENTKRVLLSAYWLLYAIVSLSIGIFTRSVFARYLSMGLFTIVVLKIFLYDTANLSDIYRFVSYLILGVILLLAGYFYYRFKDRITDFVKVGQQNQNSEPTAPLV